MTHEPATSPPTQRARRDSRGRRQVIVEAAAALIAGATENAT
ncbi:hypothetical protein [Bounagaea algeriensis]